LINGKAVPRLFLLPFPFPAQHTELQQEQFVKCQPLPGCILSPVIIRVMGLQDSLLQPYEAAALAYLSRQELDNPARIIVERAFHPVPDEGTNPVKLVNRHQPTGVHEFLSQ
jgi:hypothetical protein